MNTFTQQEAIAILKKQKGDDSLEVFAKKLGIHKQKLWNILSGRQLPDAEVGFELVAKNPTFKIMEKKR